MKLFHRWQFAWSTCIVYPEGSPLSLALTVPERANSLQEANEPSSGAFIVESST